MESLTAWSTFALAVMTFGLVILAGVNFHKFVENVRLVADGLKAQGESIKLQSESIKAQAKSINLQDESVKAQMKALDLTQALNEPLCAVKDIKIEKARDEIIKISAIIKNFGNYAAKNALIDWKFVLVKDLKQETKQSIIENWGSKGEIQITILPQHEFERFLLYVEKKDFDAMVVGYQNAVGVILSIKYKNIENKMEQYSCFYLITRMLTDNKGTYEVSLQDSKLEKL